jgi:hypothetical protein
MKITILVILLLSIANYGASFCVPHLPGEVSEDDCWDPKLRQYNCHYVDLCGSKNIK